MINKQRNAGEPTYSLFELFGRKVLFSDIRSAVDMPGIYMYWIRHRDDDDSVPATLEKKPIRVNFYGLIISSYEIKMEGDFIDIGPDDYGILDDDPMTIAEYVEKYGKEQTIMENKLNELLPGTLKRLYDYADPDFMRASKKVLLVISNYCRGLLINGKPQNEVIDTFIWNWRLFCQAIEDDGILVPGTAVMDCTNIYGYINSSYDLNDFEGSVINRMKSLNEVSSKQLIIMRAIDDCRNYANFLVSVKQESVKDAFVKADNLYNKCIDEIYGKGIEWRYEPNHKNPRKMFELWLLASENVPDFVKVIIYEQINEASFYLYCANLF